MTIANSILLTIVTPVAYMAGRLQNLQEWLPLLGHLSVEVILIHDKKDEATGVELRKLVNDINDSRIKFLEGNYGGPGLARNEGLRMATGDWVCFWDSDDIPLIHNFYLMVQNAQASDSECAVGGFIAIHETSGKKKLHLLSRNHLEEIAINPGIWRFAFKRSSLEDLQFSSLMMAEDQIFLAKFRIPERRIEIFSQSVYQYFVGENFHLTKSKQSLSDLPTAIRFSASLLDTLTCENESFVSMLLSRQVTTALRTVDLSIVLKSTKALFSVLTKTSWKKRRKLIKSIFYVICNRESIL